jgi:hypothetical protein
MVKVKVTVAIGARKVAVEDVPDLRAASMLKNAGREVEAKLEGVTCPVHGTPPKNVRVHFDKHGVADLKLDSCCEELGKKVSEALG